MPLQEFHSVISRWFQGRFKAPTLPQSKGWPRIVAGEHTLIAAPTGSGKTLTAFLAAIDRLLKLSLAGELTEEIRVVYVSPLRALSNDMHRNLEVPLAEIVALAESEGQTVPPIRAGLRTGDTSASERAALLRHPPHILVTTPESLYLLLGSERGRKALGRVETVIIDEIHALVRDKRGSHMALSLERLAALTSATLQRIGLSATQRPIDQIARFLVGTDEASECSIVDAGHQRDLDLAIEVPPSELGAVCMHEQWAEVNARIGELINTHRSTLIFVNTRRMAERLTHQLTELLGEDVVSSHHGSLAADHRLSTERRLKNGTLKAVVATASLELGLDIGYIDLVIQIGSPRSIATFLQRVGRSGHALGLVPKGRLFALTRDELMECMALIRAIRAGRLDVVQIPEAPLDILAQQIVAEVSAREWDTDELFALCQRAYSYRNLTRPAFDQVLQLLSEGITHSAGRGRVYLHHDQVGRRVRARPGARIAAATSGGAIPEIASYRVIAEPEHTVVGTLDEEFATESQAGEIFLLGNTSWRIQYVRGGDVTVTDAGGAPPSIPFWRGEAPGRTRELSEEVSQLREELERRLPDPDAAKQWLIDETAVTESAAEQMVTYAAAQQAAIGFLPTLRNVVFERFFDESGGMQLVVHAPFGARITKAWGLALRKRFCRSFDFELQATADDDGLVLSLGPQHSFPLESMFGMLTEQNFQPLLEQALLAVPTFQTRWRWNVTRALLVLRQRNGKKVPPALQRFRADDLLTSVFPKLTGCQENVTGDIELPDHPLVNQSMHDALTEAHDLEGLRLVLGAIDRGEIKLIARDTREPSPFSYELLNANPYAFLDGGEAAERRTRAVATRRSLTVESVSDLGRLDPEAIARVRSEAQPFVRTADELHDVLLSRIALPVSEGSDWLPLFEKLREEKRAATLSRPGVEPAWIPAERLPAIEAAFPDAMTSGQILPALAAPPGVRRDWTSEEVRVTITRGLLEICGPITGSALAHRTGMTLSQADAALEALEGEGVVLRGRFTPEAYVSFQDQVPGKDYTRGKEAPANGSPVPSGNGATPEAKAEPEIEWCHRRLLSRIHRLTMEGLRKQIEPVGVDIFQRFLTRHHGLYVPAVAKEPQGGYAIQRTGPSGVAEVVSMLQGLDLPAVVWERDLLPGRIAKYRPEWLDELCLAGEVAWGRLFPKRRLPDRSRPMSGLTRVVPLSLFQRASSRWLQAETLPIDPASLSSPAAQVHELLKSHGAMFAADLLAETGMLPAQLSEALGELVSQGFVTADGFAGLRKLIAERSAPRDNQRLRRQQVAKKRVPLSGAGRWSLWRRPEQKAADTPVAERARIVEEWAWLLLRRWGVVFRDLLDREDGAPRWFELLQVLRRLEARGEIRGGRFITGVAGEQFALGDTVRILRQLRDAGPQQELVVISAADPLNLVGVLTNHDRITRNASNRIAFLDGRPVASLVAGDVHYLVEPTDELRKRLEEGRLLRTHGRAREEKAEGAKAPPAGQRNGRSAANQEVGDRRNQKSLFRRN